MNLTAYQGRKVFLTGHTGFKGSWMCHVLALHGAIVQGYSLEPPTTPSLFALSSVAEKVHHEIGDVRDLDHLRRCMDAFQPDIVFHLAAQPIVRESYRDPAGTYATNVMGTVHLMEAARLCKSVRSIINVTTDKVYRNEEWAWGYRETDTLDGYDPYSNSKSCSELVTSSYVRSFFRSSDTPVSTCRAGNVIGGGDFAKDRILPDAVRAAAKKEPLIVRNPHSVRPYQHVLEPVVFYLKLALQQMENPLLQGSYNIGPEEKDCVTTGTLAELFCTAWGDGASWQDVSKKNAPHEAGSLRLDCAKAQFSLGYRPAWTIRQAVEQTVAWSKVWLYGGDIAQHMAREIQSYLEATRR